MVRVSSRRFRGSIWDPDVSVVTLETGEDVDLDEATGSDSSDGPWKYPVRAASTANVTIATGLNPGDVIDGVTLADGDRVLLKNQSATDDNGIWVAGATPARAPDFDEADEVPGAVVQVLAGTANAGKIWATTNTTPPVIDTDPILFVQVGGSGVVLTPESSTPIQDGGAGAAGSDADYSRGDHKHPGDVVAIAYVVDGGGSVITAGSKGYLEVPFAATITAWRIVADVSGSAVVDVKKATYSGLMTTSSIAASAKPTLSTAQKNQDTTLTGWTTSITAGDWLEFYVDSASTVTRVVVSLTVRRT